MSILIISFLLAPHNRLAMKRNGIANPSWWGGWTNAFPPFILIWCLWWLRYSPWNRVAARSQEKKEAGCN